MLNSWGFLRDSHAYLCIFGQDSSGFPRNSHASSSCGCKLATCFLSRFSSYSASPLHTMAYNSQSANILANFRSAYAELWQRVTVALRTQIGDAPRLAEVRSQALELMHSAQQVQFMYLDRVYSNAYRPHIYCISIILPFHQTSMLHLSSESTTWSVLSTMLVMPLPTTSRCLRLSFIGNSTLGSVDVQRRSVTPSSWLMLWL